MLKINKQSITLTKGDDASLRLVPRYKDKTIYTVQEGDSVIFRLKVGASVKELECVINLENNKIVVNFTPADTKDFEPGIYRYEAELITSLGFHYTFIADQPFILGNEIEQRLSNATSANGNSNGNYPEIDGEIGDEPVVNGDIQPTNPMMDYEELNHLPKLNGKTIKGDKGNEYYGIPTKLSEMDNDDNYVQDADYQHTDNNFSDEYKGVIDNLGTASGYDVPVSGNAGNDEVVLGNDTRLSDARPASDVSSWAKAPNKPTYSASEVGAIPSTDKGSANGVAELDANGKVPSAQLPAYVDDVLEYASVSAFPETGESGKIYIALDTNKTYRWGGSAYAEISESLVLGETSSTAYRGDKGKTAYDHATETKLSTATASGLYKVASTAQGHIAGLTPVEKTDITALGIPAQDTTYNDATTSASGLMSANDKTKLNGIANGAQVNVQSDFAQTDTEADDFIKNKPTKVSDFTNDSGFTKVESSTTNGNIKINGIETQVYDDSEIKGELTTDTTTIEGNPLNFTTLSAQTAKSTILSVEPIQDLHGYDKPWVGGAGKNLLPLTIDYIKSINTDGIWSGNTYTRGTVTFTIITDNDDNITGIQINGTPNIDNLTILLIRRNFGQIFNGSTSVSLAANNSDRTYKLQADIYEDGTYTGTLQDGVAITRTKAVSGVITCDARLAVVNGTTYTNLLIKPQLEIGNSPTSFEPYTNICPISGRTKIGILGCGKNLLDYPPFVNATSSQARITNTTTFWLDAGTYTISKSQNDAQSQLNLYKNPGPTLFVNLAWGVQSASFTINERTQFAGIEYDVPANSQRYAQIELGSRGTDVEPYTKSNDLTISLGQTVYGGTLDVENGTLTVDMIKETITDFSGWFFQESTNFVALFSSFTNMGTALPDTNSFNDIKFDIFENVSSGSRKPFGCASVLNYDNGTLYLWNNDYRFETGTAFKTYMNNQHLSICYKLATPITINLTPHTIKLLKGVNNISTDGDKITLTYRNGSVATLGDLTSAVDSLDGKIEDSKILTDTVTGDKYKLVVTSGVLSIEQISN